MEVNLSEKMYIIDTPCYKCKKIAKVAIIASVNGYSVKSRGPKDFTLAENEIAQRHGAIIQEVYSKTMNENYLANICASCRTFFGEHFLFTGSLLPALNKECEHVMVKL